MINISRYPIPLPILEGPLKKNTILQHAERLFQGQIKGPESFAVDENGNSHPFGFLECYVYK